MKLILLILILFATNSAYARYVYMENNQGTYEPTPYNPPVNVLGSQTFGGPREKLGN